MNYPHGRFGRVGIDMVNYKIVCCVTLLLFLITPQAPITTQNESNSAESLRFTDSFDTSPLSSIPNEPCENTPSSHMAVVWGWCDNVSFVYWNETLDQGIVNATVQYWWISTKGFAFDVGNGTYLVPIDTKSAYSAGSYPLTVYFTKDGQEPLTLVILIHIQLISTEIVVSVPLANRIDERSNDLLVPFGDSVEINFFYNDTDSTDGYIGGIRDAFRQCELGGPTTPMSISWK